MKYALLLGMLSFALALGAIQFPQGQFLLIWAAFSFGAVALGYARFGARVFGKRPDGRIPWFVKLVLLPYLGYTWTVWHLYRFLSREDPFNRIDDDLVIGRRLLASEVPSDFDHYVDLTAEFEEPGLIRSLESYRCLPVLDASVPTERALYAAAEATKEGSTYIHCAQGHGRTGLFALALLIHRGRIKTVEDGIAKLKMLRPAINLNREQTGFIERYLATMQNKTALPTPLPGVVSRDEL